MKHAVCHLYNRTYSDMQHSELNSPIEMLIQVNTLNQNCLSSKCDKNFIRSLHYLLLFRFRP